MPVASSDQQRKTRRVTPDRPSLLQSPAAVRSPWRRKTRPSRPGRVESPGSGRPASKFSACARSGRTGQPGTVITRGTTFENRSNLAESFLSQVVSRYEGTRLGRQELSAEILDDIPGALWTRAVIDGRERLANCRKCRELSLRSILQVRADQDALPRRTAEEAPFSVDVLFPDLVRQSRGPAI